MIGGDLFGPLPSRRPDYGAGPVPGRRFVEGTFGVIVDGALIGELVWSRYGEGGPWRVGGAGGVLAECGSADEAQVAARDLAILLAVGGPGLYRFEAGTGWLMVEAST